MPRPSEDRERIVANLKKEDRERLGKRLIEMGYAWNRGGKTYPNWTTFVEAIASGDIILSKKLN